MPIKIYIDQGHNPMNPNAGAEGNGYREQDLVYTIGKLLARRLEEDGRFAVRLSRPYPETNLGVSNADSLRIRVEDAEAFGANLFLSLHTNASENPAASGSEALVYREGSQAYVIAEHLLIALRQATGLDNRGVFLRPGLYVLRRTSMPAVLMELGYITNRRDANLLAGYPGLFADGLYRGLLRYYGL